MQVDIPLELGSIVLAMLIKDFEFKCRIGFSPLVLAIEAGFLRGNH
jgi:hypothetical protein